MNFKIFGKMKDSKNISTPPSQVCKSYWWNRWQKRCKIQNICITSKAALITLLCLLFLQTVSRLGISLIVYIFQKTWLSYFPYGEATIVYLVYPLAGYLADNVIGRYKTFSKTIEILIYSLSVIILLLFIFVIVKSLSSSRAVEGTISVLMVISIVVSILLYIGFYANVIQFGMEQLYDSPADHKILYIYWYVWIINSYPIVYLTLNMIKKAHSVNIFNPSPWTVAGITLVLIIGLLSFSLLALCSLIVHRNKEWFLINPSRNNPIKTVYRITRFARHHKVPVNRSAFTYCEDEIPTGLDLAKSKYGGPFTTDEVEGVKAFYGILKVIMCQGMVYFAFYASNPKDIFENSNHFIVDGNVISSAVGLVLMVLYLCVCKPLCCHHSLNMFKKMGLGILFLLASLLMLLIGILLKVDSNGFESCAYSWPGIGTVSFKSFFNIIPPVLSGISFLLLNIGQFELISAQSPPSMNGLLIGVSFAVRGLFQGLGILAVFSFNATRLKHPTCGLTYYGLNIVVTIVSFFIYVSSLESISIVKEMKFVTSIAMQKNITPDTKKRID